MYRSNKSQIIYTISGLHMDRKRIGTHDLWMQLFLLQQGELRITGVLVQLVRIMTVICVGSLLFTSSMLMNVTYGLMTGIGTIDRLKKKATNTMGHSVEEPISLEDVFGMNRSITWLLPTEPLPPDYDRVVGFSMPQRLLREGGDNTSMC